jgi:phosphate transport system permease protein
VTTTAVLDPGRGANPFGVAPRSRRRRIKNLVATGLIVLAFLIALIPLVFVIIYVMQRGIDVISWEFWTKDIPFVQSFPGGGMGPAVVGTLLITGAASLMAIPLGILGGIWLNEYGGRNPLARLTRFLSEVMTGVPSIVMGLFIYTFVVLHTKEQNGLAGALALACLMLPIVIRTTDQMLSLVPRELREGSYALGSRKSRTIRTVVLPNAAAGIVSGALLAVARAAGETAPLLFTIGFTNHVNWSLRNGPTTALSVQIFKNAASAFPAQQDRAWGAALTLITIVFVFTILARVATAFFSRRQAA